MTHITKESVEKYFAELDRLTRKFYNSAKTELELRAEQQLVFGKGQLLSSVVSKMRGLSSEDRIMLGGFLNEFSDNMKNVFNSRLNDIT